MKIIKLLSIFFILIITFGCSNKKEKTEPKKEIIVQPKKQTVKKDTVKKKPYFEDITFIVIEKGKGLFTYVKDIPTCINIAEQNQLQMYKGPNCNNPISYREARKLQYNGYNDLVVFTKPGWRLKINKDRNTYSLNKNYNSSHSGGF